MTTTKRKPRRWRRVEMDELQRLWASLRRRGILYNGMTHAELVKRYGVDALRHRMGHGWYKLTTK